MIASYRGIRGGSHDITTAMTLVDQPLRAQASIGALIVRRLVDAGMTEQ